MHILLMYSESDWMTSHLLAKTSLLQWDFETGVSCCKTNLLSLNEVLKGVLFALQSVRSAMFKWTCWGMVEESTKLRVWSHVPLIKWEGFPTPEMWKRNSIATNSLVKHHIINPYEKHVNISYMHLSQTTTLTERART